MHTNKKAAPDWQRQYERITEVVEKIWVAGEQPCGKRLVQMLLLWLPHCQRRYGKLLATQCKLAERVSPATLDRLLGPLRSQQLPGDSAGPSRGVCCGNKSRSKGKCGMKNAPAL